MSIPSFILIFLAAAIGSAVNSVAGGGTLETFPAIVWLGVLRSSRTPPARSRCDRAPSAALGAPILFVLKERFVNRGEPGFRRLVFARPLPAP